MGSESSKETLLRLNSSRKEGSLILETRCPHCSAAHIVSALVIGTTVTCPKCGKEHPVHPKAVSATEGLLAAILSEQREQSAILRRVEGSLFALRLLVGIAFAVVLVFGLRISFK